MTESRTDYWLKDEPYHYEIIHGKINGVIEGGYKQYKVQTINRLGRKSHLCFPKTSDVGRTAWLTYDEAVESAERRSDRYDYVWGRMASECPIARPWRGHQYPQGFWFDFEEGSVLTF